MSEKPTISILQRAPESVIRNNEKLISDEYDVAVDAIVETIPEQLSNEEKLARLYDVFLKSMTYDFATGSNVGSDGLVRMVDYSQYCKLIEGEYLMLAGKYAAVLNRFGVCAHFSKAFKDIAESRLGVPCEEVTGRTKRIALPDGDTVELSHVWNQVRVNGEVKNIDVTYGLFANDEAVKQEKGISPDVMAVNFFLVDSDELRRVGPHHDFEDVA